MKKFLTIMLLAALALPMFAAGDSEDLPGVGSWSVGITFNPVSLGQQISQQPKNGEVATKWLTDLSKRGPSLYMLSQDPVAAVRVKYRMAEKWNFRASVGVLGSHVDYHQYVTDDLAKYLNPNTENQVMDEIHANANGASIILGAEFTTGKKLKFVAGFNVMYAVSSSNVVFNYGNALTALNPLPTSAVTTIGGGVYDDFTAAQGITWARPLERNNDCVHGLGVSADMGIEWFFLHNLSLGAAVTFTPVMFTFQGQTYTTYEGFSTKSNKVEQYNKITSDGSWGVLYGTENLGLNLSLNYYF